MNKILTPDDPEFFLGSEKEIRARINKFLHGTGEKYGHAEDAIFDEWENVKYERPIVDVVEWLNSDEYMGKVGARTFEVVKEDFFRVMSMEPRPMRLILKGAIGYGKTFMSALVMARIIYELSCLRSPQIFYGLAPNSRIVLMNMSVTKGHAKKILYLLLKEFLDSSPYFVEHFPRRSGVQYFLDFPQKKIAFVPGSSSELAPLGENLFGGVIEEANFFPFVHGSRRIVNPEEKEFDAAKHLENAIWRRMKSRYQSHGRIPGMLVLNSSARYPDDYLERLSREVDPTETVIIQHAEWETKPKEKYSGKKFFVFTGDQHTMPKIVEDKEKEEFSKIGTIMEVPEEYRGDFTRDITGSLRDIAGVNVKLSDRFIPDDERIDIMFERGKNIPKVFGDRWETGVPCDVLNEVVNPVDMLKLGDRFQVNKSDYEPEPMMHPLAVRYIHIDLSSTGDSTGFCMLHVGEVKEIEKRLETEDGDQEVVREMVPIVYVDVVLKITPPDKGEIEFEEIRNLIHRFHEEAGIQFAKITFDQYQSRHSQQLLKKRFGDNVVQPLSVDRTPDAYLTLKEAINEKRILCGFYAPLSVELRTIVNVKGGKVDHLPNASKDCSDALAGAVLSAVKEFDKNVRDEMQFGIFEDDKMPGEIDQNDIARWLLGRGPLRQESTQTDDEEKPKKRVWGEVTRVK